MTEKDQFPGNYFGASRDRASDSVLFDDHAAFRQFRQRSAQGRFADAECISQFLLRRELCAFRQSTEFFFQFSQQCPVNVSACHD